jgi:hypothetical protein
MPSTVGTAAKHDGMKRELLASIASPEHPFPCSR